MGHLRLCCEMSCVLETKGVEDCGLMWLDIRITDARLVVVEIDCQFDRI